jgi:hypothetical protein
MPLRRLANIENGSDDYSTMAPRIERGVGIGLQGGGGRSTNLI